MKIEYKHLDDLYRAYASAVLNIDGEPVVLIASEEEGYPCYMYQGSDFSKRKTVWEKGGGCMAIVQIPHRKNEFLAIRDFYQKESPSRAKLVWGKYHQGEWVIKDVLFLPFLHRFELFEVKDEVYFVGATIADDKDSKDDWSRPGSIYRGKVNLNLENGITLEKIYTGLYRNHGFFKSQVGDAYFGSDEGVLCLSPVQEWRFSRILSGPVGEIALLDVNGDGVDELITIEPFHGNTIRIYAKKNGESYTQVYEVPFELDFAHTLVSGTIRGEPYFFGGIRRMGCELFSIQYTDGDYHITTIDTGGPSNLAMGENDRYHFIASANHTRNEAAIYFIEK